MANTGSISQEDFEQASKVPLFGRPEVADEPSSQAFSLVEILS
jgi:hypothetical protein